MNSFLKKNHVAQDNSHVIIFVCLNGASFDTSCLLKMMKYITLGGQNR